MRSSVANLSIRIALIAALTLLLSGWTCGALFVSCQGVVAQPQITSLSPNTIPGDAQSVLSFVGAVLKVPEKPNVGYRRGIYAIFLNGYVVSFEVQARDEERIQQVLSSAVKITSNGKQ